MVLISTIQFAVSAFALFYAIRILKQDRPSFLAIYVIVFAAFDSLGLALAPYLPLESISYLNNPSFLIRGVEWPLFLRQCSSHWIFLCLGMLGLRWEMSWPASAERKRIHSPAKWAMALLVYGVLLSLKYYVSGPGWDLLRETRLRFDSTSEAITHRVAGYQMAGFGQGSFMASVAAYIVFPLAAALAIQKKSLSRWAVFAFTATASISYALQTRQKAPLLWTSLSYLILILAAWKGLESKLNLKKWLVPSAAFLSTLSIAAYRINFGQSLAGAIKGFFFRAFIIPGATETNYFVVFPESLAYRGLQNLLTIPLGRLPSSDAVSIYDTARAATGDAFSANASFLAVSWSAAGFLAILLVSVLLVGALLLLDHAFRRIDQRLFMIALALSPAAMITLISDGLLTHIGRGGLVLPVMLLFLAFTSSYRFAFHH